MGYSCYDYFYLFLGALGYALGFTYRGSLSPIVDALQEELNTTSTGIGLLSSGFYISYALMQIPGGLLLEIYSPTLILLICWIGLGICVISFGFLYNLTFGIIIQFLSGIFVGPLFLGAASEAQIRFGNKHLALTMAIIVGSAFISVLLGGILQSYLFDEYNIWRHFFWGLGGMIIIAIIILLIVKICDTKHAQKVVLIEHDMDRSYHREMDTFDDTKALLERRHSTSKSYDFFVYKQSSDLRNTEDEEVMKKSRSKQLWSALKLTVRNYANWIVGIHGFCITTILLAVNGLWLIPYLMEKFNYSRSFATLINGLFYISSAIGGIVLGKLVSIYPNCRKLIVIICTLLNSCTLIIIYVTTKSTHFMIIILLNCISGFATVYAITFALLREYNPKQCGDTATGFAASVGNTAGLLIPFLVGELMDYNWNKRGGNDFNVGTNERHYTEQDYNFGFLVLPCILFIQIIVSLLLKQPKQTF